MKKVAKIFFKIADLTRSIGKNLSREDRERNKLLREWHQLNAKKKFRTNYPELTADAIVFDLGGYEGQWASDIFAEYLCEVYVFEPHPVFFKSIANRFKNNDKIKVYEFGLASKKQTVNFSTDADATSMFKSGTDSIEVQLKSAKTFLENSGLSEIDLMKINIEGGEYDLLEHLIDTNWIGKIKNIQIQFHHFVPNATERMLLIQEELRKTHTPTYLYNFFWENWELGTIKKQL